MSDEDLSARLKAAAEEKVGGKALTSEFGTDCFALADKLLRSVGAQSAADGDVPVTAGADYDWGDGILLESIQPGDILQFSEHHIVIETLTLKDHKWSVTETRTQTRPHHTAIVVHVGKDRSVTVAEQNVRPHPNQVTRNYIPKLDEGEETRMVTAASKVKFKVTGSVRAYRAVPKSERGSLLRPGPSTPSHGWRLLARVAPSLGGGKRLTGPLGLEAPNRSDPSDSRHAHWQGDDSNA